jgi:hypothetical protein
VEAALSGGASSGQKRCIAALNQRPGLLSELSSLTGWTASLATVLPAAGRKGRRFALPHATIHMRPAGGGTRGYALDSDKGT